MPVNHIIFDLHGTLTDSDKTLLCTKRGKLLSFGEERWMASDVPEHKFFEEYCRTEPITPEELKECWERMEDSVKFFPGIPELLKDLKEEGYGIHLISNTGRKVKDTMKREAETFGLFDTITLSYEEGFVKPDPRIFRAALDKIGATAEQCLMIGDNELSDIAGASGVGIRTILFKGRAEPASTLRERINSMLR